MINRVRPTDLADVVRATVVGVLALDADGRIVACNDRAARLIGRTADELIGHDAHDVLHPAHDGRPCLLTLALGADAVIDAEADDFRTADGRVLPVSWLSSPLEDGRGIALVVRDAAMARAKAVADAAHDERRSADLADARRTVLELQRFAAITEALADTTTGETAVLQRFADAVALTLADVVVIDLVDGDGRVRRCGGATAPGVDLDVSSLEHAPDFDASLHADSPTAHTIHGCEVVHLTGAGLTDPALLSESSRQVLQRADTRSALLAPLVVRGTVVGVVGLIRRHGRDPFNKAEAVLAADLARRAALAVDNARLLREQRELAVSLQTALLPATTSELFVRSAARYLPALREHRVGGDWYDLFASPDAGDVVTLIIGDVAGHDIPAATTMAALRNLLRGIAVATRQSCSGVVETVDANLPNLGISTTASAVMMTAEPFDDRTWQLTWTNAGHLAPVLLLPDGTVELLDGAHGPLLGTGARVARGESCRSVPAGTTVLLYTDGLVEQREELIDDSVERLRFAAEELARLRDRPDDLLDSLLRTMSVSGEDDIALLACHLPPPPTA